MMVRKKFIFLIFAIALLSFFTACGTDYHSRNTASVTAVSITPHTATAKAAHSLQFTANVQGTGNYDQCVTWLVNNIPGGNASLGTISGSGLYLGPKNVPYPNQLEVKAISVADSSKSDSAQMAVTEDPFRPESGYYPSSAPTSTTIDGQTMEVAAGQALVYLKSDATGAEVAAIESAIASMNGTMMGSSLDTRTIQVSIPGGASLQDFINKMRTVAGVRTAGPNFTVALAQDNRTGYQKYLEKRAKSGFTAPRLRLASPTASEEGPQYWVQHIHADQAWALSTGSAADQAVLGIVDSGVEADQKIMSADRIARYDSKGTKLTDDDTKNADKGYHGRWVTGFAAGFQDNSDSSVRGVALQNRVVTTDVVHLVSNTCVANFGGLSVPCSSSPTIAEVSQAIITTMKQGAKIINLSLAPKGIACVDDPATDYNEADQGRRLALHQTMRDALTNTLEAVKRNDSLLVVAAGNECEKGDNQYLPEATKADAGAWTTHALGVTASNSSDVPADFANMGTAVDLAAPGEGVGFWSGEGFVGKLEQELSLKADSGASYAAPLVTGTAGLLRSVSPTLYAPELRYILLNSADKMPVSAAPNLLLNAGRAVSDAVGTSALSPLVLPPVTVSGGNTKSVNFDVTVPTTTAKGLDVVFLIDTTGSYGDDIANLQASAQTIIDNLSSRGLDIQFGVTSFADFPFDPYGDSGDRAFYLNQPVTADTAAVKAAIDSLDKPLHSGNDGRESQLEALFQTATGSGRDLNADGNYSDTGEILPANIGWRTGSLKVIVISTDADFHDPDVEPNYPVTGNGTSPGFTAVINALRARGVTVVALNSGGTYAQTDLQKLVDGVGGILLDLSYGGANIADQIAAGIDAKLKQVTLTVDTVTGSEWISSIDPASYDAVKPGETRTFTVNLVSQKRNAIWDQSYDVILWVRADASAILERVRIPIVVPKQ